MQLKHVRADNILSPGVSQVDINFTKSPSMIYVIITDTCRFAYCILKELVCHMHNSYVMQVGNDEMCHHKSILVAYIINILSMTCRNSGQDRIRIRTSQKSYNLTLFYLSVSKLKACRFQKTDPYKVTYTER